MYQEILNATFVTLLGLCMGSFFNVVALRALEGKGVGGRSECPACGTVLSPVDLIPVVSFLILRGRCRTCKSRISPLYAVGEAFTAVAYLAMYLAYGFSTEFVLGILLASFAVICMISDLRSRLILDKFTLPAAAVFLAFVALFRPKDFLDGVAGALGITCVLLFANLLKKDGIGGGDVKMFLAVGVVLGLFHTLVALFVASVLGLFYWAVLKMAKKADGTIPFGPCIAVASVAVYVAKGADMLSLLPVL